MNLPSLPTDRLYKVQAFGGVAVVLASAAFSLAGQREITERIMGEAEERSLIRRETEILYGDKILEVKKANPSQSVLDSLDGLLRNIDRRRAAAEVHEESTDFLEKDADFESVIGIACLLLGTALATNGLMTWRRVEAATPQRELGPPSADSAPTTQPVSLNPMPPESGSSGA